MTKAKQPKIVATGEFPYPLTDGPDESRYLTWIRNHSNYMVERGFLDYFRIVAVLVRGILLNFLTLLPVLLVLSLLLGSIYNSLLDDWNAPVPNGEQGSGLELFVFRDVTTPGWAKELQDRFAAPTPFLLSPLALVLAIAWVLLFPVVTRLYRIITHGRVLKTGNSSSVKIRDCFERSFGAALLIVVVALLIDLFPLLVHFFHRLRGDSVSWTFPTVAGTVGVLIAANKVLPLLGGLTKKLAILLIGALGLLLPLLVILFVVEFLVYDLRLPGILDLLLLVFPVLMASGVGLAIVLGFRSFGKKGRRKLLWLLLRMIGLIIVVAALYLIFWFFEKHLNYFTVLAWAVEIWIFCTLAVDVNLTSIHGLYRDRLASAYLVGVDTQGEVDIEQDVNLQELCLYETGAAAPYHLVNVTLNLQGSRDIGIRDRNSDFFIFSKKFIGGQRTGYCRSEDMEQVYPQIDLGTAMAISAAAASPNMGRGTNPLMVAFMTLLNVRLGFWMPNPGRLVEDLSDTEDSDAEPEQLDFYEDVFPEELKEIERRRAQACSPKDLSPIKADKEKNPTTAHNLIGIGFSGGGIRSATINLGIAQALHRRGLFDLIDYMSTVSGGGYLGSSISTLMRYKTKPYSDIAGILSVQTSDSGETLVRVTGDEVCEYRYPGPAKLDESIQDGARVEAGQRLLERGSGQSRVSLMDRYRWRVRPLALWREMLSMLDETHDWVNLSDGGHIENLAAIELLRRRCKYIIIGDGEADPHLHFNGLATLIRYASIDLGVEIDIDTKELCVDESKVAVERGEDRLSLEHWAAGRITYPRDEDRGYEQETGVLLYLKSSFSGDEDEVIKEYRHRNPDFPHQTTADQFFDENQFEAYRALGQHIGEQALLKAPGAPGGKLAFSELEEWFEALWDHAQKLKTCQPGKVEQV